MSDAIQAVVLGATGYVGGELLRLLSAHPDFAMAGAVSESRAGQPIAETFGHLAPQYGDTDFAAHGDWLDAIEAGTNVALFSAAPHGASAAMLAAALEAGEKKNLTLHIVDSSADFRYANRAAYEAVYGTTHGAPDLLSQFTCAVPEHAGDIDVAHVGHPGCFATAVLLATVPLMKSGLTASEVFATGITGSTGSGRSPQPGTHHPERHSNLYAYKPLKHRHAPEIASLCENASGRPVAINFMPHSGPFARGIYASVQAKTESGVELLQLRNAYEEAYADAPFIRIVDGTPRLKNVVASNFCEIGIATNGNTAVVMSAIDNLVKGAAGGAVQWMNRLWGLPESTGLVAAAPGWT